MIDYNERVISESLSVEQTTVYMPQTAEIKMAGCPISPPS